MNKTANRLIAAAVLVFAATSTVNAQVMQKINSRKTVFSMPVAWHQEYADPGDSLRDILKQFQKDLDQRDAKFDFKFGPELSEDEIKRLCCFGKEAGAKVGFIPAEPLSPMLDRLIAEFSMKRPGLAWYPDGGNSILITVEKETLDEPPTPINIPRAPTVRAAVDPVEVVRQPTGTRFAPPALVELGPYFDPVRNIEEQLDRVYAKNAQRYGSGYGPQSGGGRLANKLFGRSYYNQGYYGYTNCGIAPFNEDVNCKNGGLKINGPGLRAKANSLNMSEEEYLQKIDIYMDGYNVGPASMYNSWPNKANSLPAGPHTIQLVQIIRGQQALVYETEYLIRSTYEMEKQPNIIRIDEDRMQSAPFRHRLETPTNKELPLEKPENVLRRPGLRSY